MDVVYALTFGIVIGYWVAIFFRGIFNMSALSEAIIAVKTAAAELVAASVALKAQVAEMQKKIDDQEKAAADLNEIAAQLKGGTQ